MLFSEANNEYEMNKLWNQIRREAREEGYESGLKEGFEKAREYYKSLLLEKGVDKMIVDLIENAPFVRSKPEE